MKTILKFVLLISIFNRCNTDDHSNEKSSPAKDETNPNSSFDVSSDNFKYYFDILDSASRANPNDTIFYCCTSSISVISRFSGISADSDGTQLGQLAFTKNDLKKWHEWFNKKYGKHNSQ